MRFIKALLLYTIAILAILSILTSNKYQTGATSLLAKFLPREQRPSAPSLTNHNQELVQKNRQFMQKSRNLLRRSAVFTNESDQNQAEKIVHTAPFLILLSTNEVSIAQLPLIDDGHISVAYSVADTHQVISDFSPTNEEESPVSPPFSVADANEVGTARDEPSRELAPGNNGDVGQSLSGTDAREYEQMPLGSTFTSSTSGPSQSGTHASTDGPGASLGKSEAQSVARGREKEIWLETAATTSTAATASSDGKRSRSKGSDDENHEMGLRPRRSSQAATDGFDDNGHGNSKRHHQEDGQNSGVQTNETNQQRQRTDAPDAAQESISAPASALASTSDSNTNSNSSANARMNVTSAQFSANSHVGHDHGGVLSTRPREEDAPGVSSVTSRASSLPAEVSLPLAPPPPPPTTIGTRAAPTIAWAAGNTEESQLERAQFWDIDVHMALGYVFVSDSIGRVHRIRLLPPIRPMAQRVDFADGSVPVPDGGGNNVADTSSQSARVRANITRHRSSGNYDHVDDDPALQSANSNVADGATNGQHPTGGATTASGNSNVHHRSLSGAKPEWLLSSASSTASGTSESRDQSGFNYGNYYLQQPMSLSSSSSSSKPKIIWPRSRRGFVSTDRAESTAGTMQQQTQQPHRAPLPSDAKQQVSEGASLESVQLRQMADGTQASSSSVAAAAAHQTTGGAQNESTSESANDNNNEQPGAGDPNEAQQPDSSRHLRTELAVDWLSNLLFVLDKYRLVVMDLDGENELVLIDDFTPNNRPIELRLDPANDFLYWLQVGNFHNTIYKLDLRVLSLQTVRERLLDNYINLSSARRRGTGSNLVARATSHLTDDGSELVALVSHHYAHPIITNLPRNTKLFIIDHKHSRIYVPLVPDPASGSSTTSLQQPTGSQSDETSGPTETLQTNKTILSSQSSDDAEVFGSRDDATNSITHLNNSIVASSRLTEAHSSGNVDEKDCNTSVTDTWNAGDLSMSQPMSTRVLQTQIVAYNLDGTDVGPVRGVDERGHLYNLEDMQDITLDAEKGLLYWLTNNGKELFEEFKNERDSTLYSAQHNLDGKRFQKVAYFENTGQNQPMARKSRFSVRYLMQKVSSQTIITSPVATTDRHTRSDSFGLEPRFEGAASTTTRLSRNAPYIILAITCLAVLMIYLIYALVFQQVNGRLETAAGGPSIEPGRHLRRGSSSLDFSSIGSRSHSDTEAGGQGVGGFPCTSIVRRWIARPVPVALDHAPNEDTTASSFNRREETSDNVGSVTMQDTERGSENCYDVSNAIDEHYAREDTTINDASDLFDLVDSTRLANLSKWPTNMHDLSNKLYVPAEVARDEALANIRRVSIDQLEIEKGRSPLGEGHFGTVLQGIIKCTVQERDNLLASSINNQVTFVDQFTSTFQPTEQMITFGKHQTQVASSTASSSGHGSSSTSSEFVTARSNGNNSRDVVSSQADYLTPKSNCDSTISDYAVESSCQTPRGARGRSGEVGSDAAKLRVAIKKLRENATAEEKRDFLQEAKLLASFDHPNIVHLIGISLDRGSTLIVMELMLGGDLIRYMQENTPSQSNPGAELSSDDLMKICLDIVNGCCYLEELNYIHRDLAARNCLVSSRKRDERVVKLADFGLARDIYKDSYYKKLNDSAMPLKWMAPECLIEQKFTTMSDVWSFGVVMWEVMSFCQEKPYCGVEPFFMKEHLTSGARLRKPDHCSNDMYKLMNQCWRLDPRQRPTFQECRATLIEIRNTSANSSNL